MDSKTVIVHTSENKEAGKFPFPKLNKIVMFLSNEQNFKKINDLLHPKKPEDYATYFATLIMFKIFMIIYDAVGNTGRTDLVEKIYAGLYKDLPTITSSVSGGVAENYFKQNPERKNVYFGNCGTGAWKLQKYERTKKGLEATANFDFETLKTSINQVFVPNVDYGVKKTLPASMIAMNIYKNLQEYEQSPRTKRNVELMAELETRLATIENTQDSAAIRAEAIASIDREVHTIPLIDLSKSELVIFVTGTIRNWAEKHPNDRQSIEYNIRSIFTDPILARYKIRPHTETGEYLMTQRDEGVNEFTAVINLNKAIHPDATVVFNCGVGRGTAQGAVARYDGSTEFIEHDKGMDNWPQMVGIYDKVSEYFNNADNLADFIKVLENTSHPVVAFKSGFLIPLNPKMAKNLSHDQWPTGAQAKELLMSVGCA